LRSCSSPSSPSSSGAVSGSNGFEAVSNGWYSLAIKPEKMRNHRGKKKREPGLEPRKKKRQPGRGCRETEPGFWQTQPATHHAFIAIFFVLSRGKPRDTRVADHRSPVSSPTPASKTIGKGRKRENRGKRTGKTGGELDQKNQRKKRTKNTEEQKNRNPENGGKIPRAKTETNANIKLRKPTIDITIFSIAPLQIGNKKERRKKRGSKKTGSVFLALPWSQNASKKKRSRKHWISFGHSPFTFSLGSLATGIGPGERMEGRKVVLPIVVQTPTALNLVFTFRSSRP